MLWNNKVQYYLEPFELEKDRKTRGNPMILYGKGPVGTRKKKRHREGGVGPAILLPAGLTILTIGL